MPTYEDLMEGNWYEGLYEEMTPKLIKYISVKTGDWENASDLTQDVWMKHYSQFEEVIDQGSNISIDDLTYQIRGCSMADQRCKPNPSPPRADTNLLHLMNLSSKPI